MADNTCNAVEVYEKFQKLTLKEMKRAITTGVRKGLLVIRNQARRNLRSLFPTANRRNPKYNDTLVEGIRSTRVKEKNGEFVGYVMATSNRKSGSGSYRLVFLEGGTVDRKTRKGYNRGRLQAAFFFTSAVASKAEEYNRTLVKEINNTIEKINQKNLK